MVRVTLALRLSQVIRVVPDDGPSGSWHDTSVAGLSLLPVIYFALFAKSGARKCGFPRSLNLLIA